MSTKVEKKKSSYREPLILIAFVIFDPFVQAETDARSVYQGTGLGMSIAKALIEQMGGTLEVSSELGVGSTFVVTIPFELAGAGEVTRTEKTEEVSIRGMRILLAEDNELNREIAETILKEEGAEVTSVANGRKAVDAVRDHPPPDTHGRDDAGHGRPRGNMADPANGQGRHRNAADRGNDGQCICGGQAKVS